MTWFNVEEGGIDLYVSGWTSLVYRVLPTLSDDLPDAHPRVQSSEVFSKDIHRGISPSSHLLLFIANCPDKEGPRRQPSGMMKSQSIFLSLPNLFLPRLLEST